MGNFVVRLALANRGRIERSEFGFGGIESRDDLLDERLYVVLISGLVGDVVVCDEELAYTWSWGESDVLDGGKSQTY